MLAFSFFLIPVWKDDVVEILYVNDMVHTFLLT